MLQCDICLSELVMKDDGSGAVCPVCGIVYTVERLRRKLADASSSSPVTYQVPVSQQKAVTTDPSFEIIDGCLAYYFGRKTEVVIPDGVTSIGAKAFAEKSFIESVVIPDSVTHIYESAFEKCSHLHSVHIGAGVRHIGENAFNQCYKLRQVHITDLAAWCEISYADDSMHHSTALSATPLANGGQLLLNGQELTDLTLPDGISVGPFAFIFAESLTSVRVPAHTKFRGKYNCAFNYCSNLRSVHFEGTPCGPDDSKCYGLFTGCDKLESVHFDKAPCLLQAPARCTVTSTQEQIRAREAEKIRSERRSAGVCQHCGGKFSFLTQTCTSCKTKKDYR